jgi:outer membrane protein
MKQKRTGVLIGPALTEKYGWKEGDRVPLKSLLSANRDRATGNLMLRQYSSLKPALLAGLVAALPAPLLADDLRDALNAAYATNPSLQGARAQQRATDETVPIARAAGLPSLQGASSYTEFLKNSANNFTSPDRAFDSSLQLSVPVYSGGGVKNSVLAAETRVKAGQADLRGAESGIFSRVVASYMDVILAEAVVGLNRNNVEVLTVNLRATRDRFEIGDLTRTDVAQSQARLALAQGDLRSAQSSLIAAREFYLSIVGKPPVALQPPPPLAGLPDTPAEATQIALDNNPDLIAARQRSTAAGFDVRAVSASRLPRISVFTGLGYTDYLGTLGGTAAGTGAFTQSQTTAQAGIRASIPMFQGGLPAAQRRQAQARENATMEQEIAIEREVIATVRAAFASWQATDEIIASSQSAVDAATLSLEGVRAENSVGNRTILDILDAERELLQAQTRLVTARRNAYVAGFSLLSAMGMAEARDLGLDGGPLYDPDVNYQRVRGKVFDWDSDPAPVAKSTRTVDSAPQDGAPSDVPE